MNRNLILILTELEELSGHRKEELSNLFERRKNNLNCRGVACSSCPLNPIFDWEIGMYKDHLIETMRSL
jgi:hypothetical protein|nr:MAG TPA: SCNM1 Zinc-finger of sodium channel modifier 1 [Caudoviricetes sp.]